MRAVTLVQAVAKAEALRLRLMAKRQAMRGAWGAAAAIFAMTFLMMLHLTIFVFLAPSIGAAFAALILLGLDALMIGVSVLLAMQNKPSKEENEAAWISRQARRELASTAKRIALVTPFEKPARRPSRMWQWLLPR